MDKIIEGVKNFHASATRSKSLLGRLAHRDQEPQALVITCADSRIQPEVITQADPGDIFMVRNVGNLVPTPEEAWATGNHSIGAALEFGLEVLGITDIVVIGHSACGAMSSLLQPAFLDTSTHLSGWLSNARQSLSEFNRGVLADDSGLSPQDRLSQINVVMQMQHVLRYSCVQERVEQSRVAIHGWYFDMANAQIHIFDADEGRFRFLDEAYSPEL